MRQKTTIMKQLCTTLKHQVTAAVENQALVTQNWSVIKADNKTNKYLTWKSCADHIPTENMAEYDVIGVCGVHWDRFAALKSHLKERCCKK
jgi:Ni2+-binding GTPase involved in maturation of urease and hydrogenase